MILILIALILLILSIIFAVKTDKVICKMLPVVIVLVTVFYLYSVYSFPISSLVKKEFPENYKIEISEEIKEEFSEEKSVKLFNGNNKVFNGMKYGNISKEIQWSKEKNKTISLEDSDYDSTFFVIQYYDFYNEINAEKAFDDIVFFTNNEVDKSPYRTLLIPIMKQLSDEQYLKSERNVSNLLIKKVKNNPDMITSYSISERYNFMSNPLLGFLPGERYISVCAYKDGQYIVVIHENNRSRSSNMYEMLEYLKNESKGS